MRQAYISPAIQVVPLLHNDIITESPIAVNFGITLTDDEFVGAADRYRDWE